MTEQKREDNAHGEPTTPTPSTPTKTATRDGGQHPADPNNLGSPSDRSRGQAPGAHSPSPTTRCTVHIREHPEPPMQRPNGTGAIEPSTTDTTRPHGGRATGERTAQQQLVDPEPDNAPSQRTDYSARATDQNTTTTPRQPTPSLDRKEYGTQNTDYSHIPQRDNDDLDSPSDRSLGPPGAHTPGPAHRVYSAQREEPRPNHATTQWHTGHCPRTADKTGPHGGGATGGQTAQRRLGVLEPDHTPSRRTDYSGRATNRTISTTPRQPRPSLDRTEYSASNTDYSH